MAENRQYDYEYKVQAGKLAKEIGQAKAAKELGKENRRLKKENDFLEGAGAFFAVGHPKSAKTKG